jgi:hypothetical protein
LSFAFAVAVASAFAFAVAVASAFAVASSAVASPFANVSAHVRTRR